MTRIALTPHATRRSGARGVKSRLAQSLLLTVSAAALGAAIPAAGFAQSVPAGCTPDPATAGDTITCVAPPTPIGPISTNVDDLTINIGDGVSPTRVENLAGDGITLTGSGFLTLNIADGSSVSGSGLGVRMDLLGGTGDLTLNSTGVISGRDVGIRLENTSTGAISIDVGAVTATGAAFSSSGIRARQSSAGSGLSITTSGAIDPANSFGVYALSFGSGAVTMDIGGAVEGAGSAGIFSSSFNDSGVSITLRDSVASVQTGVFVFSSGSGLVTIETDTVTAISGSGIAAYSGVATTGLTISANGPVLGGFAGISATNAGTGALSITATSVTGAAGDGIYARNGYQGTDLSITATGLVSGPSLPPAYYASHAIDAANYGSGAVTLQLAGANSAHAGVRAYNSSAGTDLTISSSAAIVANGAAILATNLGSGMLSVDVTDVTSSYRGLVASNHGTDMTITATGVLSGGEFGLIASNYGSGDMIVRGHDAVGGSTAIFLFGGYFSGDIDARFDGALTGTGLGAGVNHFGVGSIRLEVGSIAAGYLGGVRAYHANSSADADMTVIAHGTVQSDAIGLDVRNLSSGAITVEAADVVTQTHGAIAVAGFGGDISVTATGSVSGAGGLDVRQYGFGSTTISTADVNGGQRYGIYVRGGGSSMSVTASGAVTGRYSGVSARHSGTGDLTLDLASVTSTSLDYVGVYARNSSVGAGISLTASDAITGGRGILVLASGSGPVDVDVTDVTGLNGGGILLQNTGYGDTALTASGTVTGVEYGVRMTHFGPGRATLNLGQVTGVDYAVVAYSGGSDLSITATGSLYSNETGLEVRNVGTGDLLISVVDVTGVSGSGLNANLGSLGGDLSVLATDSVSGYGTGVYARSRGHGSLSLSLADVSASGAAQYTTAIDARVDSGSDLNITATGLVSSTGAGIMAVQEGFGDLSIQVADVTTTGRGIYGVLGRYGANVSLTATGAVNAGAEGIRLVSYGSGSISVDLADVTSTTADGVNLNHQSYGGGLVSLGATGDIRGGRDGVNILQRGSGGVAVTVGDVTGGRYGIYVRSFGGAVSVAAGAVGTTLSDPLGAGRGVHLRGFGTTDMSLTLSGEVVGAVVASNRGSGVLTVSAADVTGRGYAGIFAENFGTDLTITSSGSVASGSDPSNPYYGYGVMALNRGSGALSINVQDAHGEVVSGVLAVNSGTDLAITATGSLTGGLFGLSADNYGSGSTMISVVDATGQDRAAISARNVVGTDLTITATGSLTGGSFGLSANNYGSGSTMISVVDATGQDRAAISASNGGTDLTVIATGTLSSGAYGAIVSNTGSGATSVSVVDVTGGAFGGLVVRGGFYGSGTDVAVTASGMVSSAGYGIRAGNWGTGALTVTANDVTSTGYGYSATGITALNAPGYGSDVVVTATGTVSSGGSAIVARNYGSGITRVTANNTRSTYYHGSAIRVVGTGTDLEVLATGTTYSDGVGVGTRNSGTGASVITVGDVTGARGGIVAVNDSRATDLIVTAYGVVSSDFLGISAINHGSGVLSLQTAAVTARSGNAITAIGNGSDLTITAAGDVTAGDSGIHAVQRGGGSLHIDAETVTAGQYGIVAVSYSGTETVVNTTGAVTGGTTGLFVLNRGFGATTISGTDFTGLGRAALDVSAGIATTDMTITTTGTVTGYSVGVSAFNAGSGATTLTVNDVVNLDSSGEEAAILFGTRAGTSATLTATGSIYSSSSGIVLDHRGSGLASLRIEGTVLALGRYGLFARAGRGSSGLSITTLDDVAGGSIGLLAVSFGAGGLDLSIGGDLTGGEIGLWTETTVGTTFDVRAGQTISGGQYGILTGLSDDAGRPADSLTIFGTVNGHIGTGAGDDVVTLAEGGLINGVVLLGADDDTLNLDGGRLSGARGGDGTDTLNFRAAGGGLGGSGAETDFLAGFEVYNFLASGYALSGIHSGLFGTNFLVGDHFLFGSLDSLDVLIASGASLEIGRSASIGGTLTNNGALGLNATGVTTLSIDGGFTQGSSGTVAFDLYGAGFNDQLVVSGDVALAGELVVRQRTGSFEDAVTLIDGGTGLTGSFDTVSGLLADGLITSQAIVYDPVSFNVELVTRFADLQTLAGFTPNQASIGIALNEQLAGRGGDAAFRALGFDIANLASIEDLAAAYEEFNPEPLDAGLQIIRSSQQRFALQLLNAAGPVSRPAESVTVASLDGIPGGWPQQSAARVWGSAQFAGYQQDRDSLTNGFETTGYDIAAGVSGMVIGPVSFGLAAGYTELETRMDGPDADRLETAMLRAGAFAQIAINPDGQGLNAHLDTSLSAGAGSNTLQMDIVIAPVGFAALQESDAAFTHLMAATRLTVDGVNGESWWLKPHLLFMADAINQTSNRIGLGTSSALAYSSVHQQRVSYGFGASLDRDWRNTSLSLSATALHHTGDMAGALNTAFAAPGLQVGTGFDTNGRAIEDEYLIEGALEREYGSGLSVSLEGFVQAGDLDGQGVRLRLARTF